MQRCVQSTWILLITCSLVFTLAILVHKNGALLHANPNSIYSSTSVRPPTYMDRGPIAAQCAGSLEFDDKDINLLRKCAHPVLSLNRTLDERIDNLQTVDLPFLENYRNPCWYERLPKTNDELYLVARQMFKDQAKKSYDVIEPLMTSRRKSGKFWRLRCLPLVYVIGVAKCGTTDLWSLLIKHPHIIRGATKEPMFWNYNRWVHGARLSDFLDLFDEAAEIIRSDNISSNYSSTYHPSITYMSVETLFRFRGTALNFHDNDNKKGPDHVAAKMIKNITPGSRIILLVRNPVDRLYSEYLFFNRDKPTSPEDFHALCRDAVDRMSRCLRLKSARSCVYDEKYTRDEKWVRLVAGMYAPFVQDWLQEFPDMKVYRTEDYHTHRVQIYTDILNYIGLDPILPDEVKYTAINNKGPIPNGQMLEETRRLLQDFYHPFNLQLSAILNDTRYHFLDTE